MSQNEERTGREVRYFSEDFRKKIVKEIEDKLTTVAEVCRIYKVSRNAVHVWIRRYSLNYQKQIVKVVELESESEKRKQLEKKLSDAEKVAGAQAIELAFYDKLFDILEKTYGMDFKKNIKMKSLDGLEKIRNQEKPQV